MRLRSRLCAGLLLSDGGDQGGPATEYLLVWCESLPFYGAAGTYTVTLSTGQTYQINTNGTSRFFGAISSIPIEWASFSYNNDYLIIDNFTFGTSCDSVPPVLSLPNDLTVEATSAMGSIVNYAASATDNIDEA